MTTPPAQLDGLRSTRQILLRDTVTFLSLFCITAVLFGITWLLFRSFTAHREALATRWSQRGRDQLAAHQPEQAINALRTALSFAPDDRPNELLLAEALAEAGHTDEATNYFLGLWEATPGDGFINLQLARLARQSNKQHAHTTNYYRASIYGSWEGQAVEHRRQVRLELADYLIDRHNPSAAREELLIAASNNSGDAAFLITDGDALVRAGDPNDALNAYQNAVALQPHNRTALERAGRLAYSDGDYTTARNLLLRADREPSPASGESQQSDLQTLIASSNRLLSLSLSRNLPPRERAEHLLEASTIARDRLKTCSQKLAGLDEEYAPPADIETLELRWAPLETRAGRLSIAHDIDAQEEVTNLIGETETTTAKLCGPPTGDNALLLRLIAAATRTNP